MHNGFGERQQLRRELGSSSPVQMFLTRTFNPSWLMVALALNMFPVFSTLSATAKNEPESSVAKRLDRSKQIIDQTMSSRDTAIPSDVLAATKCIAVVPSMVKVALGVGGRRGNGVVTCRTTGGWSAPAPISVKGGSLGLQIGGQSNDLVIVVLDQHSLQDLLLRKFEIGKNVAGSPGPLGNASNKGDWRQSPLLSYSQSRGVFAGINLSGTRIRQDKNAIVSLYGRYIPILSLLSGEVSPPRESRAFLAALVKYTENAAPHKSR
jgi:SH3 domain-containing YSC84-like protein 1